MAYVKGHPFPQLLVIHGGEECEWVIHAIVDSGHVLLEKGWHKFAMFHELALDDYLMSKVTADGFKMTIYDRTTSCQRVFVCREHVVLD